MHIKTILVAETLLIILVRKNTENVRQQNSIRDARTPQPREIVFNTMRYRRSETVQRSGDFQSKQCELCKGPNNI